MTESYFNELTEQDWARHHGFLRALAQRLTGSESDAEDLAQQTLVAAIERGERGVSSPRSWLARVLINFVRQSNRTSNRRIARETMVDSPIQALDTATVVGALETHRLVANAVTGLPEPYRTAVFLRYYRGLSLADAAQQLDVPVETLRTRLKRATAMLRVRLDQESKGDRKSWMALLMPLARPQPADWALGAIGQSTALQTKAGGSLLTGALMMSAWKWGAAAAVILLSGLAAWSVWPDAETPAISSSDSDLAISRFNSEPLDKPTYTRETIMDSVDMPSALPTEDLSHEPSSALVVFRGTVIATDSGGQIQPLLDGRFQLYGDSETSRIDVQVVSGAWQANVRPDAQFSVVGMWLGGKPARLSNSSVSVPSSGFLELHAELSSDLLLHVVDADSGVELDRVDVCYRRSWRAIGKDLHPGNSSEIRHVVEQVPSPILIPARRYPTIYWARAAGGYAWTRIAIDPSSGGERTVKLGMGGGLEVRVDLNGRKLPPHSFMRLLRPGQVGFYHSLELCDIGTSIKVRNLVPGEFAVLVQTGEFDAKFTMGTAQISVSPLIQTCAYVRREDTSVFSPYPRLPEMEFSPTSCTPGLVNPALVWHH